MKCLDGGLKCHLHLVSSVILDSFFSLHLTLRRFSFLSSIRMLKISERTRRVWISQCWCLDTFLIWVITTVFNVPVKFVWRFQMKEDNQKICCKLLAICHSFYRPSLRNLRMRPSRQLTHLLTLIVLVFFSVCRATGRATENFYFRRWKCILIWKRSARSVVSCSLSHRSVGFCYYTTWYENRAGNACCNMFQDLARKDLLTRQQPIDHWALLKMLFLTNGFLMWMR